MKNTPPQTETCANEQRNSKAGALPARTDTVLAAVLAALIQGRRLTGMDAVSGQHTTRLAAVVHALETDYAWRIDRREIEKHTADNRIARVAEYWLSEQAREAAFAAGARAWSNEVKTSAIERRKACLMMHA